ncbi:DUF5301 domain-containing protein [Falseniella ignava]
MKKCFGIIVASICLLSFTACVSNKKIVLPAPENLTGIEISENTSESVKKLTDKEGISKLINEIKNHSKSTNIESVNDQPVNVEHYIIIQFYHQNAEENPSIAYLYRKKDSHYIEQSYAGIWKLENEIVQTIDAHLPK